MDFTNAALLIATVFGVTELVKALLPWKWGEISQVKVAVAIAVAFGAVFLVGATAWADSQVIGDVKMSAMSVGDKVLVAVFVAGAGAAVQRTLKAVSNVGVPMPSAAQEEAIDAGAMASLERWAFQAHDEKTP